MRRTAALALSLTVLLVMAACGGGGEATPAPAEVATPVNGVVKMSIKENAIEPDTIAIKAGEKVTFQVTATDVYHTFTIDEISGVLQEINLRVGRGKTGEVTLTVDTPGTYTFYCRVTGHRGFGEEGTLIVE